MKKAISLILALLTVLLLCACGSGTTPPENTDTTDVADTADTTDTTADDEPEVVTIDSIIKNAVLQYPASNDLFKYNIYDTYVEITEYIGDDAAAEVIVPATLENLPVYVVDSGVFDKCSVQSIVFEDGIYNIKSDFSAFVVSVTLPSTLNYVGYGMFENCYALTNVVIPEGIDSIQTKAFMHCHALTEVTIPSTVTMLSDEIFAFCAALETVNLPSTITIIGNGVFTGCEALKNIVIPEGVTKIGSDLFLSSGIETVEIPSTVTEIGHGMFSGCEALVSVTVHATDIEIIPLEGYSAAIMFSGCNPDAVVYAKAGSAFAQVCATENIYFELLQ